MAKRQATPGEESPYTKRRKLQGEESAGDKDFDIKSPKELRDLLFFDQDATCEEAKRSWSIPPDETPVLISIRGEGLQIFLGQYQVQH